MKIKVGIVGYGNLGKAVEQEILKNKDFKLIAIFSRRTIKSSFDTIVEPYDNFVNYKNKIDIMFLCGGSKCDLEIQTPEIAKYFDVINTFDTHAKIKEHFETLDNIAKKSNHRAIISCGWDPGLFSLIRVVMQAISGETPTTFWGKGISMGHSDALRNVKGVEDAVQFTLPNKQAVKLARQGKLPKNMPLHFRDCHIVSNDSNHEELTTRIKNIPNYFKGQPTSVNFVNMLTLSKLKKKMFHKGEIVSSFKSAKSKFSILFKVSMDSNPEFTAKIMISYTKAILNLKQKNIVGAFTPLDIPASFLLSAREKDKLWNLC